jgi:hypothetical protein
MDISLRRVPDGWIAGMGFALVLAPLVFVTTAVLESLGVAFLSVYVDFFAIDPLGLQLSNLVWPALFLGGLALALGSNLYAILGVQLRRDDEKIAGTLTVTPKLWNLAVMMVSGLLLATMVTYALLENFAPLH